MGLFYAVICIIEPIWSDTVSRNRIMILMKEKIFQMLPVINANPFSRNMSALFDNQQHN
jgi:hypothetical protein